MSEVSRSVSTSNRKKKHGIRSTAASLIAPEDNKPEVAPTADQRAQLDELTSQTELNAKDIVLGELKGAGTFGEVFKGKLRGKDVAVKKLAVQQIDEAALDAFKKEVAIMSKLKHPNVLLFMGAVVQPGNLMIVTELMLGNVRDILNDEANKEKLTFKVRMDMAKGAALGMNALHSNEPVFMHRDLKTTNLLVDEHWNVKISDFGLSHVKTKGDAKEKFGALGTPLWMAPEVLLNKEYDESADLYSYGLVLWELLTGQNPYPNIKTYSTMVEEVCKAHSRPPIPADCPPGLKALIQACWDEEPSKRPKFSALLSKFDNIMVEGVIRDEHGIKFWKKYYMGKDEAPWDTFVKNFAEFCGTPLEQEDQKYKCLKDLLDKNGVVSMEAFHGLLQWFGPFKGADIFDRVTEVLKEKWFHGDISAPDTEKILLKQGKKGVFLIRFSSTPGSYSVSVVNSVSNKRIKHFRVLHVPGGKYEIGKAKCSSLGSVVTHFAKELGLGTPCPGSKYQAIFDKKAKVEEQDASIGYMDVTDE